MSLDVATAPTLLCLHCASPCPQERSDGFCCSGCLAVSEFLGAQGLNGYYDLKKKGRALGSAAPVAQASSESFYRYLDDPDFLKSYALHYPDQTVSLDLYVEGVHCTACLWLIEKLPELCPPVLSARLNLSTQVLSVRMAQTEKFSQAAALLERIGYRPHPVSEGLIGQLKKQEDRTSLIRIGVAGAVTGNLMLLAIALYAGATGVQAAPFRWFSGILFLPVLFYSATPFYRSALGALRVKQISIDIPLVIGILLGSLLSYGNLIAGKDTFYFDSLAALVFFLLSSRYVLHKAQNRALSSWSLMHFLTPSMVRKIVAPGNSISATDGDLATAQVRLDSIQLGDILEVRSGENFPVDGQVVDGQSTINCSLLTGEFEPLFVQTGDPVFAGTVNTQSPLWIRVEASGTATRLGRIIGAIQSGAERRAPIALLADRRARLFMAIMLLVAPVTLIGVGLQAGWQEGLNRALALLIISCPCALALATPLAMTLSIGKAARNGILIKSAEALERLSLVKELFVDKTGTLTHGIFEVQGFQPVASSSIQIGQSELIALVSALEARSNHPIAQALVAFAKKQNLASCVLPQVEDFSETIGVGVRGKVGQTAFEIRKFPRAPSDSSRSVTQVGVYADLAEQQVLLGVFSLADRLRDDARPMLQNLSELGIQASILSGDSATVVLGVADRVGIPAERCFSEKSPEEKASKVAAQPLCAMVGDGANDAIALKSASVGIAVHSGMEISLQAADVYVSRPGLTGIADLFSISHETLRLIRRNFALSLIYNLIGVTAALLGYVTPIFAAIIMPLSAFTVFASTLWGTRKLRKL